MDGMLEYVHKNDESLCKTLPLSRSLRLSLIFKRGYFTVDVRVCSTGFLFYYAFFQAFKIGIRLFVPIEFCWLHFSIV